MNASKKAMLQMFICAVLWSCGGFFIKMISLNSFAIAGFRSLFAMVTVYVFMKSRGEKFRFTRGGLICVFFLASTFFSFVSATKLTTAANAIVLQYTAPVFILVASALLFKEKFLKVDLIVVPITLAGIVLCFFDQMDGGGMIGNLLGVLSGVFMGGMFMAVRRCNKEERMSGILMGHLLTAMIGIPCLAAGGGQLDLPSLGFLAIMGVVQIGIPYILCGLASEHCSPLASSLIGMMEPLLNPVWVAMYNGEIPGPFALAGAAIVIIAITFWCIIKERMPKEPAGA